MEWERIAHSPFRAPSSPPETPIPMYLIPTSATLAARRSEFSYLHILKIAEKSGVLTLELAHILHNRLGRVQNSNDAPLIAAINDDVTRLHVLQE